MTSNGTKPSVLTFWATLCFALLVSTAAFTQSPSTQTIHIQANRLQLFDKGKRSIYTGNAMLTRNTITIHADKIEVLRDDENIRLVKAWGKPATLINRDPLEPMASSASYFMLNNQTQWLTLETNAIITQQLNQLQGDRININLETQEADIQGGYNRAQLIIEPKNDSTP